MIIVERSGVRSPFSAVATPCANSFAVFDFLPRIMAATRAAGTKAAPMRSSSIGCVPGGEPRARRSSSFAHEAWLDKNDTAFSTGARHPVSSNSRGGLPVAVFSRVELAGRQFPQILPEPVLPHQ
jgi:hypothetical protein